MSARPNRFQSPTYGARRPPVNNQNRMYLAGANTAASGSAAQLLPPGNSGPRPNYGTRTPDHVHAAFAAPAPEHHTTSEHTPYPHHSNVPPSASTTDTFTDKYQFASNPFLFVNSYPEPDDDLHTPNPRRDKKADKGGTLFTARGVANVGCLLILVFGLLCLFAGYPIIVYYTRDPPSTLGGYNLGGINASGQVPEIPGNFGLIDNETPKEAYTQISVSDGTEWDLVFSDEFNTDGRTFYPGDDPFWEAVDLHYWGTNNLEWYDPEAIITGGGYLNITLRKKRNHNVDYQGGFLTSWNKFCFTGGRVEASVSLPGKSTVYGLWPAFWTMGNLGRAGYGASLEGMWPYTYDSCDVGTLHNQTYPGTGMPKEAAGLSYLPGQRLSACTCPEDKTHPGPKRKDGTFVGRSAPEIDVFEATVTPDTLIGYVSQSGQWAPFNHEYRWNGTEPNVAIYDKKITDLNSYIGGWWQEASSALTKTNQDCYTQGGGCFTTYGFEYQPGSDGFITWVTDGKPIWTLYASAMGPDPLTQVDQRPITNEPLYMIFNLGMSKSFGAIDFEHLEFPTWMLVDWVRIYQPRGKRNIGCDPEDFPTSNYINRFIEAYTNPNLTTWVDDYKQVIPKNRLIDTCESG